MSDSSSSDEEEESKFKAICDPTLWSTASEGDGWDRNRDINSLKHSATFQNNGNHCERRESFILLEKLKVLINAAEETKKASPLWGSKGPGTRLCGSRMGNGSSGSVTAPSTLSPYLAKQLAVRLDKSVGYNSTPKNPPSVRQERDSSSQYSFPLLRNLSITHQDESKVDAQPRGRVKVPKRLSYYASSDEEDLKTKCSRVAVTSDWILAGGESCPRPHPKNVRYLEEYKVEERRPDGSIVAVSSSALDSNTTLSLGKRKNKKTKKCASESEEKDTSLENDKLLASHNGAVTTITEDPNSHVNKPRKQARKRGKKKKGAKESEVGASKTDVVET